MNATIARRFSIRGRVQGVNYRRFAATEAAALDINGYAKNLDDGSVEVLAEGASPNLELLAQKLSKGPPAARVDKITSEEIAFTGHKGFAIR